MPMACESCPNAVTEKSRNSKTKSPNQTDSDIFVFSIFDFVHF